MPNIESRVKRRIQLKRERPEEIKTLLAAGLTQIISELGGQVAAVRFSDALWGNGITQGSISKALNHHINIEKIHLQFCQLFDELDHRSALSAPSITISNKLGALPRFHSILKRETDDCLYLYLDCYQSEGVSFIIVIDKNGEERHINANELSIA